LQIPRSVHDAVWRRARELRAMTREVVQQAAVIGRHFRFDVIHELTGFEEDDLLECIRELIYVQLIGEQSPGEFMFRHALTREAIYERLLGRERRSLHHSVAEAIERQVDDVADYHAADLAYHFDQAAVWEKSYVYATQARDRARSLLSPRAAAEH
jgi:predicted ATPase